jgi:hypothetical protein
LMIGRLIDLLDVKITKSTSLRSTNELLL